MHVDKLSLTDLFYHLLQ